MGRSTFRPREGDKSKTRRGGEGCIYTGGKRVAKIGYDTIPIRHHTRYPKEVEEQP